MTQKILKKLWRELTASAAASGLIFAVLRFFARRH